MKLGIRTRLLAAFVATALFTGVLGWYAIGGMERMNEGERLMSVDVFGGTQLLATYIDDSWQARADMLDYLLSTDAAERETLRAEMVAYDAALVDCINRPRQHLGRRVPPPVIAHRRHGRVFPVACADDGRGPADLTCTGALLHAGPCAAFRRSLGKGKSRQG